MKGTESLFREVISENFPNLGRDLDIQVHKTNTSPCYFNPKLPYIFKTFSSNTKNSKTNNLTKEIKDIYTENHKPLMKRIKDRN